MLIVLAADLSPGSTTKDSALAIYRALKSIKTHKVSFMKMNDAANIDQRYDTIDVRDIKEAIVIAFTEIKAYMLLDRSNILVYLANHGIIESFMTFMMGRVDCIVATNYKAAYMLGSMIQQYNVSVPIYRVEPFVEKGRISQRAAKVRVLYRGDTQPLLQMRRSPDREYTLVGDVNVDGWQTITEVSDYADYDIYICLTSDDYSVRKAMMAGVTPIVRNMVPYPEIVVHGTNGFIVNKPSEMMAILDKLDDPAEMESMRLMTMRSAANRMSEEAWANAFISTINGIGAENLNLAEDKSTKRFRGWIVPKKSLEAGTLISIPRNYNRAKYQTIELESLEQILMYFSAQNFMEVYVFDWDYGEYNEVNYGRIMNLARALGKRGINIFWCSAIPIPKPWLPVFKDMTVLSPQEGLKRVSGSTERASNKI